MASKRFLMVPEDSSAANMPLPGVTMASATLLRSARFIELLQRSPALHTKIDRSRAIAELNVRRRVDISSCSDANSSSFRGAPTGPRKARPDDRLRANPESITTIPGYGFRACAIQVGCCRLG